MTAIGIDLGTTYSCVGIWKQNHIEIIANSLGNRTLPSIVAFAEDGKLVGEAAANQSAANPLNTIFGAKRLIGRPFTDKCVQDDMKLWPFKVVGGKNNKPMVEVSFMGQTKQFSPEEISAMVLGKMKETAEAFLGQPVQNAVVTVPAYFNDGQRQATKDAGAIADLNILRIINEPTAAAIAYGLNKDEKSKNDDAVNILIFDLGGGTFDVSILALEDGVFEVKATAGDTHLGGEDFDNKIVQWCVTEFSRKTKKNKADVQKNARTMRRLRTAAEKAKRTLSSAPQATIEVDACYEGNDFNAVLTRARFEQLCAADFKNCLLPVQRVLEDSKLKKDDINQVVLVGGSTRIPKVQSLISEYFNGKELNKSINPDEAVAHGAAVQAYILDGGEMDPDDEIILMDVAPLSLGVELKGGAMCPIITRNTLIPCTKEREFSTYEENQKAVSISVFEGERGMVKDNNHLGKFDLEGLKEAPAGGVTIKVGFNLDANGILNVTADDGEGAQSKITISNDKAHLSKEDIERMILDSETHAETDAEEAALVMARNKLEAYSARLALNIPKDPNFLDEEKEKMKALIGRVKGWIVMDGETATAADFNAKVKELESGLRPIIARIKKAGEEKAKKAKE